MLHRLENFRRLSPIEKCMLVYLIYTEGRSLLLLTAYEADMLGVKSQFFSSSQNTVALTISAASERCRCALSWVARTPHPHQPHCLATAPSCLSFQMVHVPELDADTAS